MRDRYAYDLRFLDRVIVKGRVEPIDIYEVLDDKTAALYQFRIKTLQEQGLPADWQGIWSFTTK